MSCIHSRFPGCLICEGRDMTQLIRGRSPMEATVPETTKLLTETLRTTVAEKHAIYERLLERERECASLRAELAELKRTRRGKKK